MNHRNEWNIYGKKLNVTQTLTYKIELFIFYIWQERLF